jgi:hypothetical protein
MTTDDDSTGDTTQRVRTVPRDVDPEKFPQALAAKIGDRKLWIANGGAIESNHLSAMDLDPEYVVSVNKNETWATTDHYPLNSSNKRSKNWKPVLKNSPSSIPVVPFTHNRTPIHSRRVLSGLETPVLACD